MKRFESQTKNVSWPQENVYNKLSDLENLKDLVNRIPQSEMDKVNLKDLQVTRDQISCEVSPVGRIVFGVVSREPYKCIKFETLQSPVKLTMWIQILPTGTASSKFRITADADLNVFMAKMVEKPLVQAIDKIADTLAAIPYGI